MRNLCLFVLPGRQEMGERRRKEPFGGGSHLRLWSQDHLKKQPKILLLLVMADVLVTIILPGSAASWGSEDIENSLGMGSGGLNY
jgi:hypothetical protein